MTKLTKFGIAALTTTLLFSSAATIVDYTQPTTTIQARKKAKYTKINKEIANYLRENQQYEQQGNQNFANYNTIESVKYKGGQNIYIKVNGDFLNLSIAERTELLNKIQGTANTVLLDHDKIDANDYRKGSMFSIYLGKESIGHSNISNYKTYKFYR